MGSSKQKVALFESILPTRPWIPLREYVVWDFYSPSTAMRLVFARPESVHPGVKGEAGQRLWQQGGHVSIAIQKMD